MGPSRRYISSPTYDKAKQSQGVESSSGFLSSKSEIGDNTEAMHSTSKESSAFKKNVSDDRKPDSDKEATAEVRPHVSPVTCDNDITPN